MPCDCVLHAEFCKDSDHCFFEPHQGHHLVDTLASACHHTHSATNPSHHHLGHAMVSTVQTGSSANDPNRLSPYDVRSRLSGGNSPLDLDNVHVQVNGCSLESIITGMADLDWLRVQKGTQDILERLGLDVHQRSGSHTPEPPASPPPPTGPKGSSSTNQQSSGQSAGGGYQQLDPESAFFQLLVLFSTHPRIDRSDDTKIARRRIAHTLIDGLKEAIFTAEANDIDSLDTHRVFQAALCSVVDNEYGADPVICDVLLQAGAEPLASIESEVLNSGNQELIEVFKKYFPGLWRAVESESIWDVRRLLNLWCATDLVRDGLSLTELALRTGREDIIRLIIGAQLTMKLVHFVLAGNIKAVDQFLERHSDEVQLDFRNMSQNGCPILYYAIDQKNVELVRVLVKHGAKLFTLMRVDGGGHEDSPQHHSKEHGGAVHRPKLQRTHSEPFVTGLTSLSPVEMPVFFAAVIQRDMPAIMFDALLPEGRPRQNEELLYKMLYKGQTALEVAVKHGLNIEAFTLLLERAGARVVADRNPKGQTLRDFSMALLRSEHVKAIDGVVRRWVNEPDKYGSVRRQILALWGYDSFPEGCDSKYMTLLPMYQEQIKELSEAIETEDVDTFRDCMYWDKDKYPESDFESLLSWEGRKAGPEDPLPMLHKAVIFNAIDIVELILEHKPAEVSIDNLYDHHRRTALHYAYSQEEFEEIKRLLASCGCSEHTLDRNGKEPLDFRDHQNDKEMKNLIAKLRQHKVGSQEPDVWNVPKVLREPIQKHHTIGYTVTGSRPKIGHIFENFQMKEIEFDPEGRNGSLTSSRSSLGPISGGSGGKTPPRSPRVSFREPRASDFHTFHEPSFEHEHLPTPKEALRNEFIYNEEEEEGYGEDERPSSNNGWCSVM